MDDSSPHLDAPLRLIRREHTYGNQCKKCNRARTNQYSWAGTISALFTWGGEVMKATPSKIIPLCVTTTTWTGAQMDCTGPPSVCEGVVNTVLLTNPISPLHLKGCLSWPCYHSSTQLHFTGCFWTCIHTHCFTEVKNNAHKMVAMAKSRNMIWTHRAEQARKRISIKKTQHSRQCSRLSRNKTPVVVGRLLYW